MDSEPVSRQVVFIFKCVRKGHKQEVPESEAEAKNGTACPACYSPMLVAGVKTK